MVNIKDIISKDVSREELYWSLVIEPGWVQAGIWSVKNEKSEVSAISAPSSWTSDQELINATDTALSSAIQNLPEHLQEPSKVVFGLPSYWVGEGQIKTEFLSKIKNICSQLSLEPVGFVILPEAISYLLKVEEGSPLNAVIVGVSSENIEVSVFNLGKAMGSSLVARSVSSLDDIVEGLTRFAGAEPFPSRIILYDGKEGELEDVRQALMSSDWGKYEKIKFLHTPKIEILMPDRKILAASLAGGAELAQVKGVGRSMISEDETEEEVKEDQVQNVELVPSSDVKDLGFVVGGDVSKDDKENIKVEEKESVQAVEKGQDSPPINYQDTHKEAVNAAVASRIAVPQMLRKLTTLKTVPAKLMSSLIKKKTVSTEPVLREKISAGGFKKIIILAVIISVVLVVGVFLYWWFVPRALITIYVSPKVQEEIADIQIDPDLASVNLEDNKIPGRVESKQAGGDKTKTTTGSKTVGEKAKGEIVFYRSGPLIILEAGTVLTGPNSLKFSLDDKVTVASGSASNPGKTKAAVTAENIGAEYNLAAGESFNVSNFLPSDIEAKNESAFSGGTSRQIASVSEEDINALNKDLQKELSAKALDEVKKSLDPNSILIEESIAEEVVDKTFSNKSGDEANNLKLDMILRVSAIVVSKGDLYEIAKQALKDKIPQGYVLSDEQTDYKFVNNGEDDGVYDVEVTVSASLLPEVDPDKVIAKVLGKNPDLAKQYLTEVEGFQKAEISLNNALPIGFLYTLPRVKENITVDIVASK